MHLGKSNFKKANPQGTTWPPQVEDLGCLKRIPEWTVFQFYIHHIESENNSAVEVLNNLSILNDRMTRNFLTLKVKELLAKKHRERPDRQCDKFCAETKCVYSTCIEFLDKWMKRLEEFSCFTWMTLNEIPTWNDVESPIGA